MVAHCPLCGSPLAPNPYNMKLYCPVAMSHEDMKHSFMEKDDGKFSLTLHFENEAEIKLCALIAALVDQY